MTFPEALNYLKNQFGDASVTAHLLSKSDGYCTGCEFLVGRNKHVVVGLKVNEMQLRLFADGIKYARAKRKHRAKLEPLERNPWLK